MIDPPHTHKGKTAPLSAVCRDSDCRADLVPQRVWNTVSPSARRVAEAHGYRCSGGQGFCRACYQRGLRSGRLTRKHHRKTGRYRPGRLSAAEIVRLRQAVGVPLDLPTDTPPNGDSR